MAERRFRLSRLPGGGRISSRLDRAIRWRIEQSLTPVRERLDAQDRRLRQLEQRIDERLPDAVRRSIIALSEVQRMQPQTASMELRLEELRQRFDTQLDPGDSTERAEAKSLVNEIRKEHEQIRSRMTAVAWYEERLRKVEEQVENARPSP